MGHVKILDFGLARFVSEQALPDGATETGTLLGSPDYLAPEQEHDAHTADTRADIYSMGCTLYHLLAGQVPFPATSLLAKLEAQRDQQPIPLDRVRPDVPHELTRVVAKMMAKNPAQRYQTPAEVAEALRPFTGTQAASSSADGGLKSDSANPPSAIRNPQWLALALATVLVLAGVAYWAAQIVFRVETPQGTLIVQTDDLDVRISIKSGGQEVALLFLREKKEIPLQVGEYNIELVGARERLKLSTTKFEIRSGEQKTVKVEFVPPVVAGKNLSPTIYRLTPYGNRLFAVSGTITADGAAGSVIDSGNISSWTVKITNLSTHATAHYSGSGAEFTTKPGLIVVGNKLEQFTGRGPGFVEFFSPAGVSVLKQEVYAVTSAARGFRVMTRFGVFDDGGGHFNVFCPQLAFGGVPGNTPVRTP